jgi:hypothetical protein
MQAASTNKHFFIGMLLEEFWAVLLDGIYQDTEGGCRKNR